MIIGHACSVEDADCVLCLCAGYMQGNKVALNPGREAAYGGECGVFVATTQAALDAALNRPFSAALHSAASSHNLDATPPAVRTQ